MLPREGVVPAGPWPRIWCGAVALVLVGFGALELFWRSRGYTATIVSTAELWSYHRERAEGAGRGTVALLGGSRMQFGFIPEAFHEVCPDVELVQLAVSGNPPFAALRDLAEDESFGGVVVCSLVEAAIFPGWRGQEEFVDYFREKWGPGKKVSLLMTVALQERLVSLQPRLGGERLVDSLLAGRLPPLNYIRTRFDRLQMADYGLLTRKNIDGLINLRISRTRSRLPDRPPVPEDTWQEFVSRMSGLARRLEARGGRLIFVKFPMRGRFKVLDEEYFPRERCWDTLAGAFDVTLHYEDMPGVEELHLPDDSHLDPASGSAFTKWIARELVQRNVLGAESSKD